MSILREDDLGPDGVRMVVHWSAMPVGGSIFIPCINVARAQKQVLAIFARRHWKVRFQVTEQNHILGLRIWRTA